MVFYFFSSTLEAISLLYLLLLKQENLKAATAHFNLLHRISELKGPARSSIRFEAPGWEKPALLVTF